MTLLLTVIGAHGVWAAEGKETPEAGPKKLRRPAFACAGSQVTDALDGPRLVWTEYSAKKTLGLPEWLSVSVEQRTRYETMDGRFRRGETGGDQQIPLETCVWLELSYESFRIGTEFLDAREFGADEGSYLNNTHANTADFLQIYGAWSTPNLFGAGLGFEAKGGRQTLDLGGRRLVARNAFRNTINAFTGLSMRLKNAEQHWHLQGFVTLPVDRLPNDKQDLLDGQHEFDDEAYRSYFSGLFLESGPWLWKTLGELYLFHLHEEDRPSGDTRNRRLFTPGLRFFREPAKGQIDFEVETIAQVGESRASTRPSDRTDLSHQAWYQHVQVGFTLDGPWSPRVLVQYDYASGDENPGDRNTQRFDTLFGARRWEYGPTGIFGAFARSNINSPGYRLILTPRGDLTAFFAHRLFWLAQSTDEWVGTGLWDPSGRSGDFLGHLVEVSTRWDAHPNLAFETGWAGLFKGRFARDVPGAPPPDDVNYFYVQSLVRF